MARAETEREGQAAAGPAPSLETATWEASQLGRASAIHVRCVRLEVVGGPDRGAGATFSQPIVRIGTHRSCDLVLTDRRVSRFHCEVVADPQGYRVRDLGSTNGTAIGGLRVNDAFVPAGGRIRLGESE
ncbi:MAG TPA: FHA domain-containing protein, partial [Kofleriaceae bacterium]|nr:FHA domain-containing protein [Kofleriaceae bacterium]